MTWHALLSVAIGGALGTLARVGIDALPIGGISVSTALVNLGGAFLLGFVLGHGLHHSPSWLKDAITIGFLGSFTTMSGIALIALSWDSLPSTLYVVGTFVIGILLAGLGYHLGCRPSRRQQ